MTCSNHPARTATMVCFSCGKWYCDECTVTLLPQPLCISCAQKTGQATGANRAKYRLWTFISKSLEERPWLHVVGAIPTAAFVVLGLLLSPYLLILAGASIVPQLLVFANPRGHRINKSPKRITDAQVFALLRNGKTNLTIARLAKATNSSDDAARRKLNDLVVQNVLEMDASNLEISYRYTPGNTQD